MTTLAESFLADLEDLSDEEVQEEKDITGADGHAHELQHKGAEAMERDGGNNGPPSDTQGNKENFEEVTKLISSDRYKTIMKQVHDYLKEAGEQLNSEEDGSTGEPSYQFLVECNQLVVDIDNDIVEVYNFLRGLYKSKFPELESLVHAPLEYAAVVKTIGNTMDVTQVDLDSILPAATVMVVTVTATTTSGEPLDEGTLATVMSTCDIMKQLDDDKTAILKLVQRSMDRLAPNLSAAVGSEIAARLMGVAGGLEALASIPACNIQVLGAKRKHLSGFSSKSAQPHQGFVYDCDLVQQTPPSLKAKAAKLVGSKCALLARVDAHGKDPEGNVGRAMREDILRKIEKWQEPPPAKKGEVLPVPDAGERKKTRRGGRRYRKMKEKYGMTELKKQANRMLFNQAEDEFIDGDEAIGLGAIGKEGSGMLRAVAAQQRQKLSAKAAKKHGLHRHYGAASGLATSGLSSSLAFTPIQGIELVNPSQQQTQKTSDAQRGGTESYFSELSGFRSSVPQLKKPKI